MMVPCWFAWRRAGAHVVGVPWFTMMILHKKSSLLMKVDDTLAVFHTHAVAGVLGGVLCWI